MSRLHSIAGRIGAYAQHAKHDTRETTAAARRAFMDGFEAKADPNNELSPAERQRRGEALRREHFARMQLASAHARRAKAKAAVASSASDEGRSAAGRAGALNGTTSSATAAKPAAPSDGVAIDGYRRRRSTPSKSDSAPVRTRRAV